jgi:Uma2 family endonuclease
MFGLEGAERVSEQRVGRLWTASDFLQIDQSEFGPAWRYELVDGQIIAHPAPSPEHATIVANLSVALKSSLRGAGSRCRVEAGSGAAPRNQQRVTARIPDVSVRCGERPRVVFEIVSPSELRKLRERDRKRQHLQDVEGVQEIVEIYQFEAAVHVYRRAMDGSSWAFEALGGLDAVLRLDSIGVDIPLTEIYDGVEPPS